MIKKIGRNQGISLYKKALSDHRKTYNIFFEIITVLSKCLLVSLFSVRYQIFVDELVQKLVGILKPNCARSFGALRLRAALILVYIDLKLSGGRGFKK